MKNASRDVVTVTTAASDIGVGLTAVFFCLRFPLLVEPECLLMLVSVLQG